LNRRTRYLDAGRRRHRRRRPIGVPQYLWTLGVDENGPAALDELAHSAGNGADLDDSVYYLNCAAVLVDDDGKGCAFDDGSQHGGLDAEMRDAGVLDPE
jgi:hypothetical protein